MMKEGILLIKKKISIRSDTFGGISIYSSIGGAIFCRIDDLENPYCSD